MTNCYETPSEERVKRVICNVYTNLPCEERKLIYNALDREDAIKWVDNLLDCVAHFNLMGVLNDLQIDDEGNMVFKSKWDIPLRIVNLVLAKYRIIIIEET